MNFLLVSRYNGVLEVEADGPVQNVETHEHAWEDDHEDVVNMGELMPCLPRGFGFWLGFGWRRWSEVVG